MDLISREAARELGLKRFFSGKACRKGHVGERYVSNNVCVPCNKSSGAIDREINSDKYKSYLREYHAKRKETRTEEERFKLNQACLRWQKNHPDRAAAREMRRVAAKLQRTPKWADKSKIDDLYTLSAKLTRETGIQHHVDHIVPLRGELVSGLHVHENLQVIPKLDNCKKSNKFNIEEYNAEISI